MFTSYAVVVVENVSPEWDSDIPGKPPDTQMHAHVEMSLLHVPAFQVGDFQSHGQLTPQTVLLCYRLLRTLDAFPPSSKAG